MTGDGLPERGDIWQVDFDPVVGHEQGGERPAVVLSIDGVNQGPSGLVVVVPFTRRERGNPFHVRIPSDASDLRQPSFVLCEMVRVASRDRLRFHRGRLTDGALALVEDRMRILLGL